MILKVLGACAVVVLTASSVAAQEATPSATSGAVTVTVGDTTAPPEWELSVPVSVEVAEGAQVGRLSMRLVYPATPLRYVSVRATDTLKAAGFDIKAAAPKIEGDTASVALEVQPAGSEPAVVPSGRVAILVFNISVDAEEKSWPMAAEDVQAWAPGPNAAPVKAASGDPATFTVASPGLPIFACFFYMH